MAEETIIIDNAVFSADRKTLLGLYAEKEEYTIPDGVTVIAKGAFESNEGLKRIVITGSVKIIGKDAFSGCMDLESVIISDGVTEIREGAFRVCECLKSIVIPDSVQIIGPWAFSACTS